MSNIANGKFALFARSKLPQILIILAACAFVLLLSLVLSKPDRNSKPTPPKPVAVVVEIVAPRTLEDTFTMSAMVEPNCITNVAAEINAKVLRIRSEKGCIVEIGQTLVELDSEILQADFDRADSQLAFDKSEHNRLEQAFAKDIATAKELDRAQMALGISRAGYNAAKARLDRTVIKSPKRGILDALPVEEGEFVKPGDTVATIVDIETIKIAVDVPERHIRFLRVGQVAKILPSGTRAQGLDGAITFISAVADPTSNTTRVEIAMDNHPDADGTRPLHSGEILSVRLSRGRRENVVMIPFRAVVSAEEGYYVYLVNDSKAVRKSVEIDIDFSKGDIEKIDRVRVIGLANGDRLIVNDPRRVGPGQLVQETEEVQPGLAAAKTTTSPSTGPDGPE